MTKTSSRAGAPGCTPQRPRGAWPVAKARPPEPQPQERQHGQDVHARFVVTLGSIRADLEDQPSRRAVRAAARRWCNAIVQLANEVASGVTR